MKRLILIGALCGMVGCAGLPERVRPISGFELPRYLGTWYEIARLDHRFERGLTDIRADYSLRDDGGVRVLNSGFDAEQGRRTEAEGRAYFVETPDVGHLRVSFFGPFYGGYHIIALDRLAYRYAMIAGPDSDYLWILSRTPYLEDSQLSDLIAQAKSLGFPVDRLIFDKHPSSDR